MFHVKHFSYMSFTRNINDALTCVKITTSAGTRTYKPAKINLDYEIQFDNDGRLATAYYLNTAYGNNALAGNPLWFRVNGINTVGNNELILQYVTDDNRLAEWKGNGDSPTYTQGFPTYFYYVNGTKIATYTYCSRDSKNMGIMLFDLGTDFISIVFVAFNDNYEALALVGDIAIRKDKNGIQVIDDPYGTTDPVTGGEGGYGDFDYSSDDDTIPSLPNISVTAAGFVNLFKMTSTQVADLANYLWSGLFDINTYLKLFGDPMECILSLGIVPLNPTASAPLYIVVGNHVTTLQAPRISDQFQELDCGSITVQGSKYSNSFMDYSPYTSAQLYLPYVGTVALDVDEIMDSTLHVVYHIDLLSGSCVAYVEVTKNYTYQGEAHEHKNVLYQYSGNVLTNVPITSQNFTQVLQAVIGAVAVGVSGGSAAGVAAGSGEAAGAMTTDQAAAAVGATSQMKAPVSRSGNCSSACGLLGTQVPKLMLTLPKIAYAEDMNKERGYPTYMRKTISSMSGTGFTKVELAHLKSIPCTDSERDEIIKLLESGVEL